MAKLLKYLKPKEWLFALFAAGFIVLQVWLEIKIPDYMATLTAVITGSGGGMRDIWINGA